MWPAVIAVLWGYAQRQCSNDRMRFSDGLLWIRASMMTGWLYMLFIFVLPVLVVFRAQSSSHFMEISAAHLGIHRPNGIATSITFTATERGNHRTLAHQPDTA